MSEKSMEGMMSEPMVEICSISERRAERRRVQEAAMAGGWGRRRDCFIEAKRAGSGVPSVPEREAKTEEMSPSFRGPRTRSCVWVCVAVMMVRERLRGVTPRWVRRVESIVEDLIEIEGKSGERNVTKRKENEAYLYAPVGWHYEMSWENALPPWL